MKRIHGVIFIIIAMCLFLCGCNNKKVFNKEYDLDEPLLTIKNDILTWNNVKNCLEYSIKISGNLYNAEKNDYEFERVFSTDNNHLDLSLILSPDEYYEISVKAIGDHIKYFDSEESNIAYTTKEVTPGLLYTLNGDKKVIV